MNRKEFIKTCGGICLGMAGIRLLASCASTHYVNAAERSEKLILDKSELVVVKNGKANYRKYIVVKNEKLGFPIALYRIKENTYSAVLMSCTHQNVELSLNGDILSCSAHGSEFDKKGEVIQGPAEQALKKFKVTEDEKNIYIHLS